MFIFLIKTLSSYLFFFSEDLEAFYLINKCILFYSFTIFVYRSIINQGK